ncbi:formate--tetrahydrofolate ligase [Corynebacterium diphtheriae]|uniref:Formate--tetrahydrofolate ligase n=1 Tax=Corynebacterium diphtheriae bv. gravis TaxID=1720349 RepID=A0AAX0J2V7_CORDP|nr:formate--tetrahydrofolate ligase [Corynebacterium diphtheriae]ERA55571.1 formate--tetrahydrofolate ligase [Corynebacterium diphtheriae DSM 43988]AEX67443.1 formate-tetrahydrofolate ligase [Corynebacterium diphtheriae C7 (beta)]OKY23539.1 formate--tetrahydrofolate ligase [Corynebacterium diphtheriae bv. gravis]OSQ27878.1 formate--tetrahydrofolate ligase [Corynebacterium diphtheriae]UEB35704.1 formate--tetrahydrofolate ligase [Corynebacterium diphtheriae subsp. diphtheriae]
MPTDVEIAQAHTLEPITDIANRAGVPSDALIPYGFTKAKIDINRIASENTGKLVLVTGISPTPAGEGKSTVLIGLSDAMRLRGHNSIVAIREPSLGPVMGIKGGAAGGGYSQIVPMEDINLHFTGDFHAITAANNTLAAMIDNHIHQGNTLGIDARRITWQRCLDVNDRSLRKVVTGLGGKAHGVPTETGFTITAASEIMAILCLALDLTDLEARLARIVVGQTFSSEPVTVGQLNAQGALAALLRDAVNPNLVQTLGGTPALCHGGPFANIAHGCNSLIATKTALSLGDVVLTEAGFGSDLGAEKFFDIKSRVGDLNVAATVVVATVRSLKYNAGVPKDELTTENLEALASGVVNLERHVENIRAFGIEPIVALNKFASDTDAEISQLKAWAETMSVQLIPVEVWAHGGQGALELADAVAVSMQKQTSHQLYDPELGIEASLLTIAQKIYGAADVELSKQARQDLAYLQENGWDRLPVCISKTQYSFSDDPSQLGRPEGHTLHVRNLLPRIGAGFIVALTGDVMTMPGLPKKPAAENIGVENGEIKGLF